MKPTLRAGLKTVASAILADVEPGFQPGGRNRRIEKGLVKAERGRHPNGFSGPPAAALYGRPGGPLALFKQVLRSLVAEFLLFCACLAGVHSAQGQDPSIGAPVHTWERQFGLGRLQGAAASPDGSYLATFGARGAFLWLATNGAPVRKLPGLTDWIESAAFSADGTSLATAGDDGVTRLWSVPAGTLRQTFSGHSGIVWSVAISPDGTQLLTGSADGTARLWSTASGSVLQIFRGHSNEVWGVAFSPDGTKALTGSADQTAKVWSADTGALLLTCTGHVGQVSSVAFSPDGSSILTGSWDNTAALWSANSGIRTREFKGHRDDVDSVAFSADGLKVLTAGWDKTATLWAADTGLAIQSFTGHSNGVWTAAFATGNQVLTASADQTARLWNLSSGSNTLTLRAHTDALGSVAFSPDGTKVLTGGWDKTATLWDRASGAVLQTFLGHADDVQSVAFSPDGTKVLTGGWDNTARLWQTNGILLRTLTGHTEGVWSVAISPDGSKVLTGSADMSAKLWSATDGSLIRTFAGHSNDVLCVAFSPDGAKVLTGSADSTARLWQTNGNLITNFIGHTYYVRSVAFSPDGAKVLTGSWDETAKLWQTNGTLERSFEGHTDGLWSAAFSPDGLQILTGCEDGTAKLWSVEDGAVLRTLFGHTAAVMDTAFSVDGAWLLTGSWDGSALLWSATAGEAVTILTTSPLPLGILDQPYSVILQVAGGTSPYQWSVLSGSLPLGLTLTPANGRIAGIPSLVGSNQFTVRVSDATGLVATNTLQLVVQGASVLITSQPQSVTVAEGGSANFSVVANGQATLSYQWLLGTTKLTNGARISGATSSSLTITNVQLADAGNYTVLVTNASGAATSQVAVLTVNVVNVPPSITLQPVDRAVVLGQPLSLTVTAAGLSPLAYQWFKEGQPLLNGGTISGASSSNLVVSAFQTNNVGGYTVVITNSVGAITSRVAMVTVLVPPAIVQSPPSQTVFEASTVIFVVQATGSAPLNYQWRFNGTNLTNSGRITGATSNSLSLANLLLADAGNYTVVVTNNYGSVTSAVAVLTVNPVNVAPSITVQPLDTTVVLGQPLSLTVTASGTAPLTHRWLKNGQALTSGGTLSGTSSSNLVVSAVQTNEAGGYSVVISNSVGSITSRVASVTVVVAPTIAQAPQSQSVFDGQTITFTVAANGTAPFAYQWRKNGTNLVGATAFSFSLTNVDLPDAGNFTVVVSNAAGAVTSSPPAVLTVNIAPRPDLVVTTANGPVEAWSDYPFDVSWALGNTGNASALGTWVDRVYLSRDSVLGGDILLGSFPYSEGVAVGQSVQRVQSVSFGRPGITNGNYWLIVVTDADNQIVEKAGESNNVRVSVSPINVHLTPLPNLVVESITAPTNVFSGQKITVQWAVRNRGPGAPDTVSWSDQVFLSVDGVPSSDDSWQKNVANTAYLGSNEVYVASTDVEVPFNAFGNYQILVKTDSGNAVREEDESNNLTNRLITVTLSPAPDLRVATVSAPAEVFCPGGFQVSYSVTNYGSGPVIPSQRSWWDKVYMSTTPDLSGAHFLVGMFQNPRSLGAGEGYRQNNVNVGWPEEVYRAWRLRACPVMPTMYPVVVCDADQTVWEHVYENNNWLGNANPVTVHILPPPELYGDGLIASYTDSPPSDGGSGSGSGGGGGGGGGSGGGGSGGGGSGGGGSGGGYGSGPTPPGYSSYYSQRWLHVTWNACNGGASDTVATSWTDSVYLSRDSVKDASDYSVGSVVHNGVLAAGDCYGTNQWFKLPSNLTGRFRVIVVVGVDEQGVDLSNYTVSGIDLDLPPLDRPDLRVLAVHAPNSVVAGSTATVWYTLTNAGTADSLPQGWSDQIGWANPDGSSLVSLGTASAGLIIAPGGFANVTNQVSIPETASGDHGFYAYADINYVVDEGLMETNNGTWASFPTHVDSFPPDLRVTGLSSPTNALSGTNLTLSWTVANLGLSNIVGRAWSDSVYLSRFPDSLNGAVSLGAVSRSGNLALGSSYTNSLTATLPYRLSGPFYIHIQLDSGNALFEGAGESNNLVSSAVIPAGGLVLNVTQTPMPDLVVSAVAPPSSGYAGRNVTVSWTIQNLGASYTAQSNWVDYVYLSKDQVFDPSDPQVTFLPHAGILQTNQAYTTNATIRVPKNFVGPCYVFVVSDARDQVFELNEENNRGASTVATIYTLPPPADLTVTSISPPASGVSGQPVTVNWTVQNQGLFPAEESWQDTVYLSADGVWDLNDVYLGRVTQNGPLGIGASYGSSITTNLPGVTPGSYRLIVRTDIMNNVRESDESNNTGVSAQTLTSDVMELTLGQPYTNVLTTGDNHFYKVQVPASETLAVSADSQTTNAWNELFTRFDAMPTRADYDYLYDQPFLPDVATTVPETTNGWYYNLFRTEYSQTNQQNYQIEADLIPFSITSVYPTNIGDNGQVTITIDGGKFSRDMDVRLVATNGSQIRPSKVAFVNASKVRAKFVLQNVAHGTYEIRLSNSVATDLAVWREISVSDTVKDQVDLALLSPKGPRVGVTTGMDGVIANRGNIDAEFVIVTATAFKDMKVGFRRGAETWPDASRLPMANWLCDSPTAEREPGLTVSDCFVARDLAPGQTISFRYNYTPVSPESFPVVLHAVPMDSAEWVQAFRLYAELVRQACLTNNLSFPDPERALAVGDAENWWALVKGELQQVGLWDGLPVVSEASPSAIANKAASVSSRTKSVSILSDGTVCEELSTKTACLVIGSVAKVAQVVSKYTGPQGKLAGVAFWLVNRVIQWSFCGGESISVGDFTDLLADMIPGLRNSAAALETATIAVEIADLADKYRQCACADQRGAFSRSKSVYGECILPTRAKDPNEIVGPEGYGDNGLLSPTPLAIYRVYFENVPGATAPAQTVRVRNQLPSTLDWRTFRLSEISFGTNVITVSANRSYYQTRVNLGPDQNNLLADVIAGIDIRTGQAFCTLSAIDPTTGEAPEDPQLGILPPNTTNHIGEGHITYTIKPKTGQPTGTLITNQAAIIFDSYETILTGTWTNTLDAYAPTSHVVTLPAVASQLTFTVGWLGADDANGSGIAGYDVYVADNGAAWSLWQSAAATNIAAYTGVPGHTYQFYSVARDNVGNVESKPALAETQTAVPSGLNSPPVLSSMADQTVTDGQEVLVPLSATDNDGTNQTLTFSFGAPAPTNASISQVERVFRWTPSLAQAPGTNVITITVSDNAVPPASDTKTFTVYVSRAVRAPWAQGIPGNQRVLVGGQATFAASFLGLNPLAFQWRFNGTNLLNQTNAFLVLSNVQPWQAGEYRLTVTNSYGSVTLSNLMLTVDGSTNRPVIVQSPPNRSVREGSNTTFTVLASGDGPLFYQWQRNGLNLLNATNVSLVLSNIPVLQAGSYRAAVSNSAGSVASAPALLTVLQSPLITVPPESRTNIAGTFTTFSVTAGGTPSPAYQWRFNGTNLVAETNATYTIASVQTNHVGTYTVVVTNEAGAVTSTPPATLVVWVPPTVSTAPQSRTNIAGTTAGFSVSASGTTPFTYQWRFGGVELLNQTNASLSLANVHPTNAGNYSVVVTNIAGSITSAVASLTVWVPVVITTQPQSQIVLQGADATFTVSATGTAPLTYQWSFNGVPLAAKTNLSLVLNGVQTNQAGSYRVQVGNVAGAVNSTVASLSVQYLQDYVFGNTNLIRIRDNTNALPYPSAITVSNLTGTVSNVSATLSALTHTYTSDIDALLVGPQGDTTMLMSDAGVYGAFAETFVFDDSAADYLPLEDYLVSGTYKPTSYSVYAPPAGVLAAPAPLGPYGAVLSAFNGKDPNGTWSLFVRDDFHKDLGQIANGWSLRLRVLKTTTGVLPPPAPPVLVGASAQGGLLRFGMQCELGRQYRIESSTNLHDWTELQTLTSTNTLMPLSVPTGDKCRFFRAVGQ